MGYQDRFVRKFPPWVLVAPLDAMLCVMGIPAGVLSAINVARSVSLIELLPSWGRLLWSLCLLFGCIAWLIGLTSMKEINGHTVVSRMPILIFGLYLVSLSAFVYGVALIVVVGLPGLLAAWPILVFAAGTWLRRLDLVGRFRRGGDG